VEEHHLPGLGVGVVQGDELMFAEGFLYADIESQRRQDPGVRQRIGSITKTMTALCLMALVEEGRLSLDARIVDLLPDVTFHGPVESLTVKHLLTHTGGIGEAPNVADLRKPGTYLWSDEHVETRIPDIYPDGVTIEVEPGTKWAYANHGFALLGEIVMRIEGASHIDDVLRRRVFEPLGMTNTDCFDHPHDDLSTGYQRKTPNEARERLERANMPVEVQGEPVDGHNVRGKYEYELGMCMYAAGAVQSTIHDMARYASALLRRGAGIVKPETFDRMVAPQWCPDERMVNIGLSFFRERRFGRETFGHGGGVAGGWNTHLAVLPAANLALLTHGNITFDKFTAVDGRVLQALLDAPAPVIPDARVHQDVLACAPGVHEATLPGPLTNFRIATNTGRVQLSARDGELWLHARHGPWKDGVRMTPDADDPAFFALETGEPEPPGLALVRDASGRVTGIRFPRLVEFVRTEQVEPWA
jgi:CubicO group peptidase (beta-lactamase class C family)